MPVLTLECPACGHVFKGSVLAGTRPPDAWACSRCAAVSSAERSVKSEEPHPWEVSHAGCRCCG